MIKSLRWDKLGENSLLLICGQKSSSQFVQTTHDLLENRKTKRGNEWKEEEMREKQTVYFLYLSCLLAIPGKV